MIASGHFEETLCLLEVLYRISGNQSAGISQSEAKVNSKEKGSHNKPKQARHITFGENSTRTIPSARELQEDAMLRPNDSEDEYASSSHCPAPVRSVSPPPPPPGPKVRSRPLERPRELDGEKRAERPPSSSSRERDSLNSVRSQRGGDSDLELVFSGQQQQRYVGDRSEMSCSTRSSSVRSSSPHGLSSEERVKLIQWLATFGIQARPPADQSAAAPPPTSVRRSLDLEDEWSNGVLLSELAAACSRGNRGEVKEVKSEEWVFDECADWWSCRWGMVPRCVFCQSGQAHRNLRLPALQSTDTSESWSVGPLTLWGGLSKGSRD